MMNKPFLCPKCKSDDLAVVKTSIHNKLICRQCLAYVKFLSKKDTETFLAVTGQQALSETPPPQERGGDLWDPCQG